MAYLKGAPPLANHWRRRAARWFVLVVAALPTAAPTFAEPSLERAVKASYLFKFAPFIDWPANAFTSSSAPFQICIEGQDPFGSVLDEVVRGQTIHGRRIAVRRLNSSNASNCHILFVGKPVSPGGGNGLDGIGQSVLTVSDSDDGIRGGMIEFFLLGGRVRFRIDDSSARANGLRISSKLLGLAVDRK